jgi:hypothetical protein
MYFYFRKRVSSFLDWIDRNTLAALCNPAEEDDKKWILQKRARSYATSSDNKDELSNCILIISTIVMMTLNCLQHEQLQT